MTADRDNPAPSPALDGRSRLRDMLLPGWQTRKRMIYREAWWLVLLSYPLIAFAYLWPPDFRNTQPAYVLTAWAAFMIRTFLFHAGLLYVVVAAVSAWKRRYRLLLASAPLVLVTVGPTLMGFRPRTPPPAAGETFTVMSVNLLVSNRHTASILDEIRAAAPDVLLLQEYTEHWHAAMKEGIGAEYPFVAAVRREDSFGIAIYSRRPFLQPVETDLPLGSADEPQIRAVIAIAETPVAFYNVHPLPPRNLSYFTEGRLQIADLAELVGAEQLPLVLSGDFNFTENSPQFDLLASLGLVETHELAGWGRGATWPVHAIFRWLPGLRLDRIFVSGGLTAIESRTGTGRGSDHRPVIARIALRKGT